MGIALEKTTTPLLSADEVTERRKIMAQSIHDGRLEGVEPCSFIIELGEAWALGEITLDEMEQAVLDNARKN